MSKVRLKDIAERTGVTVSTVSAALNGTGRISSNKMRMISDVAKSMGFHPNLAARLLKGNDSNIFGLIISDNISSLAGHGVFSELQERFISECNTDRLRAHVEINKEMKLPHMLHDGLVRGVIHVGAIFDELRTWMEQRPDFPFVAFEEEWEHCVLSDFTTGLFNAMQYLAATGHKRIAMICGPARFDMHRQSIEGFEKGRKDFGTETFEHMIQCQVTKCGVEHDRENIGFLNNLINSPVRPDAVILSGKKLITTAIYHFLSNGIKIPQELSIVGICSGWEAEVVYPGVTAVERNTTALTSEAIKMLMRLSKGIDCNEKQLRIPTEFKIRNTVISRLGGNS